MEIHGANGYLIHQFLADGANHREDGYGGSVSNRLRFALEVTEVIVSEVGADRTAIRLSPVSPANAVKDSDLPKFFFHWCAHWIN